MLAADNALQAIRAERSADGFGDVTNATAEQLVLRAKEYWVKVWEEASDGFCIRVGLTSEDESREPKQPTVFQRRAAREYFAYASSLRIGLLGLLLVDTDAFLLRTIGGLAVAVPPNVPGADRVGWLAFPPHESLFASMARPTAAGIVDLLRFVDQQGGIGTLQFHRNACTLWVNGRAVNDPAACIGGSIRLLLGTGAWRHSTPPC